MLGSVASRRETSVVLPVPEAADTMNTLPFLWAGCMVCLKILCRKSKIIAKTLMFAYCGVLVMREWEVVRWTVFNDNLYFFVKIFGLDCETR